jgi:hypothetical protein
VVLHDAIEPRQRCQQLSGWLAWGRRKYGLADGQSHLKPHLCCQSVIPTGLGLQLQHLLDGFLVLASLQRFPPMFDRIPRLACALPVTIRRLRTHGLYELSEHTHRHTVTLDFDSNRKIQKRTCLKDNSEPTSAKEGNVGPTILRRPLDAGCSWGPLVSAGCFKIIEQLSARAYCKPKKKSTAGRSASCGPPISSIAFLAFLTCHRITFK